MGWPDTKYLAVIFVVAVVVVVVVVAVDIIKLTPISFCGLQHISKSKIYKDDKIENQSFLPVSICQFPRHLFGKASCSLYPSFSDLLSLWFTSVLKQQHIKQH